MNEREIDNFCNEYSMQKVNHSLLTGVFTKQGCIDLATDVQASSRVFFILPAPEGLYEVYLEFAEGV